jgi:hypothetical protein
MCGQSPISPLENRPAPDFTYPAGHLVAIAETPRQLASLVSDLTCNGFHTGEIRDSTAGMRPPWAPRPATPAWWPGSSGWRIG